MINKPKFSIVTVVFNGEKTIGRTIKSILEQDFCDYEYIIQDGGSNDRTLEIANIYKPLFKGKMHVYSDKDKGIYDAMNKGIAHSRGEYIWLVNADDYIMNDALKNLNHFILKSQEREAVICAGMNVVDCNTGVVLYKSIPEEEKFISLCQNLKMGICHPATIVPRTIYDKIGVYDDRYIIAADLDFCLRCYKQKVKMLFMRDYITNMTNGGISNQFVISKSMHDCRIRSEKFIRSRFMRLIYNAKYWCKLIALKYIIKSYRVSE